MERTLDVEVADLASDRKLQDENYEKVKQFDRHVSFINNKIEKTPSTFCNIQLLTLTHVDWSMPVS